MFDKDTRMIAIDKESKETHEVESIWFPLGKPSGKDVSVVSKEDTELTEWRSIDDVDIYFIGIDLVNGPDRTGYSPLKNNE